MDKTFNKDDGLPEDENEREDSGNQQSDESLEMVNHSDISDPSNDNLPIGDVVNNPIPEALEKRDSEDIPGDPMHSSIKKFLEGSSQNNHTITSSSSDVAIEEKVVQPLNSSSEENSESPVESIQAQKYGSKNSLEAFNLAESTILKNAEMDTKSCSSVGSVDSEGNRKDRRRTYHVRHNTVTIASTENVIAKEIASVINELADSPPDTLMTILQKRLTEYAIEKENEWKAESERSFAKAKALLEMKQAYEKSNATSQPTSRPVSPPPPTLSATDMERLIRERDQSHEHASATMRSLREIIRQQELLMDKEQSHSEHIRHIQNEMNETNAAINQLHNRYNSLLADAEEELLQADVAVNRIHRELDDSMVTLRFKVRQQEMTIRSHETTVENLQAEKKELLDICEDLVAHTEAKHPLPPEPVQQHPEMDDIGGF
jgi:hypothetical protein